ncbi:hypothetical protein D9758_016257 [Tetrapyrgos nigripes]|uniref:Helicase ATP-binding domain-containing protein n=1 Tax=Tetrapyrgos nigripes TaxID=182062 RepID=A0A8H5BYU5_9AGAR|nr:hypothetical protein D9758_016257 [Tetrapyrgos nigripes]
MVDENTPGTPSISQTTRIAPPETPRKRKEPTIRHATSSPYLQPGIKANLSKNLLTSYTASCVVTILFLVASTGYGKSLVFEGVSKLAGKRKLVIVICPLKALERDQVEHATAKGIKAYAANEDTVKTPRFWQMVEQHVQMLYISPEMALSPAFLGLFKSSSFRRRTAAIFVDCIDEWGEEEFRPQYRQLDRLRLFTGNEIPVAACTATCQTDTFDIIWDSLGYGHRPFWGLDCMKIPTRCLTCGS